MARVADLVAETQRQGFQDVVFVAMGDSNLAAETVAHTSSEKRWRRPGKRSQHKTLKYRAPPFL
jgi:fructoselysine-6-P-deglycase FrlB-like protein